MKRVNFDWSEHFTPLILIRGKKYFEEGRVNHIQHIGSTYIANVEGTEEYEVEITVEDGSIKEMLCDCPYAQGDTCKHMAAVLYALETENVSVEELPSVPTPPIVSHVPMDMPWLEAIDKLPEETVRKELMKRADRDDRLRERLVVLYLGKLPEGQIQNWKADLQKIAFNYADRRGRIVGENVWEFTGDLGNFLDAKLPILFEVNALMDAFWVIWIVMETALEWYVNDEDGDLDDLFEDCEESLRKAYAKATDAQREQMMQWYQEHRNPEWPGGVANVDHIFRSLTLSQMPVRGKRTVKYIEEVPYFFYMGQWICFPKRGKLGLYYDFVEDTAIYKEVEPIVDALIKENLGQHYYGRGSNYVVWPQRKRLLMEMYGIEWYSPIELNPRSDFE